MGLPTLVTPNGATFLKDWPAANGVNCDDIDDYAGPCLRSDALSTYTPNLTGSTADPTLGASGTIKGFYFKIFDQIYTWGEFRFKTGFTAGTGDYIVTLPFAAKTLTAPSTTIGKGPILGAGHLWDASAAATRQPLIVQLRTATQIMFGARNNASSRQVDNLSLITWAIDDGISWSARYQRQ